MAWVLSLRPGGLDARLDSGKSTAVLSLPPSPVKNILLLSPDPLDRNLRVYELGLDIPNWAKHTMALLPAAFRPCEDW